MVERRRDFIINIIYFAIILAIVGVVFKFTTSYLMPFVVGFLIAFVLKPIISRLTRRFGNQKWSSLLVILIFYIIVASLFFWAMVGLIAGVQSLATQIPSFYQSTFVPALQSVKEWVEVSITNLAPDVQEIIHSIGTSLIQSIDGIAKSLSSGMINFITGLVASVPRILLSTLIAIISSFFFTLDYESILNGIAQYIPEKALELMKDIKHGFVTVLGKYAKAYAKLMSLTFVELTIAFFILGIPNPMVVAVMVAVVDILPVLGTGTIMIPWFVIEFITGNSGLGTGLLITYLIITVIRNILEPKIVGDQIGLHPLMTLILIYVGVKLFGFVGLFGLPISATILKTLHDEGKISFIDTFKSKAKNDQQPSKQIQN